MKAPTIGLATGIGLLVGEGVTALRGLMESFGAGDIVGEVALALVAYVGVALVLDLAAQPLGRKRPRLGAVLRAAPFLVLCLAGMLALGINAPLAAGSVALAAVFALACHVPVAWPLAGGMAAVLLVAVAPRPSAPTAQTAARSASGPSIALIVLDTVRLDRTSAYGAPRETTPVLTALASRGVRYDRAYATSCWSIPTHATLFTGLMPGEHGAHFESLVLGEEVPVVSSILAEAGWETAGFTGNPYISEGTGFARGFSHWEESWRPWVVRRGLLAGHVFALLRGGGVDKGGADVVAGIERWMADRSSERPFFLFVNLMEAHAPYQDVPHEFQRRFVADDVSRLEVEVAGNASHDAHWTGRHLDAAEEALTFDLMDGATAAADHYLGLVLELLPPDALVVVVSDHGELVGEHDLYGHMTSLYEPLVHVPLVMAGPGVATGAVVSTPVSTLDVVPTLLHLGGVPAPEGLPGELLSAAAPSAPERVVHAEHFNSFQATRFWTQHRTPAELASVFARRAAAIGRVQKRIVAEDGSDLGFDLGADPMETNPFPGERTGLAVELPGAPARLEGAPRLDPAQLEALRSLGYVH